MPKPLRVWLTLPAVVAVSLPLMLLQWLALRTGLLPRDWLTRRWHGAMLRVLRLKLRVSGELAAERPLLVVSNHVSWTDILVLGSVGDVAFIAKAEVARWPFAGTLARLQRSVFVERGERGRSADQAGEIARRLSGGDAMVLFPEGTTADGTLMLPFKSSLFGAAELLLREGRLERVWVQPAAIAYTRLHGLPMSRWRRTVTSWIGDASLLDHVGSLLGDGPRDIELAFGEPLEFRRGDSRKELARRAEAEVRRLMVAALRNPAPRR